MTHVYTRERHENKNTRFWATYGCTSHVGRENPKVIKINVKVYMLYECRPKNA